MFAYRVFDVLPQRHSTRCTESFMRENVMEELKQIQPDDETKRKTLDILKRVHLEDEMSFDEEEDVDDVGMHLSSLYPVRVC